MTGECSFMCGVYVFYHGAWFQLVLWFILINFTHSISYYLLLTLSASDDRAYITLESYVRLGRPLMDVMGIRTILLLTDSQDVIKEAVECKTSYPDVCRGITFRYINKKRFQGSEGGL